MKVILALVLLCCVVLPAPVRGADTVTTASGLKYVILKKGDGRRAQPGEVIIAHYTGTLPDGALFDSSRDRNEPFVFQLGKQQVIKGWDEGFALLNVGDRALLIIPPELAYGKRGAGIIGPNATLIFDVELLDVKTHTLGTVLLELFENADRDSVVAEFRRLKADNFGELYVTEYELNRVGYSLLQRNRTDDAIAAFQMYVEVYPESFNSYDSLGEAYKMAGNTTLAILNYERSLELNPDNENARRMLAELKK